MTAQDQQSHEAYEDGKWYWVEHEGWSGQPSLIAPARYKADCDAWYSIVFSGISTRFLKVLEPCERQAARALPEGIEPDGFLQSHPFGLIFHRGKPSRMQLLCGACPPIYTAARVQALLSELEQIGAVAACFGADWPDVEGEPEVLRRVKWAARQLKAQERAPLTDERISEIDDETHFHESPSWPLRFARAIEAEIRKASAP